MFIIKESVWAYSLMDKTFGFGKKKKKKKKKVIEDTESSGFESR